MTGFEPQAVRQDWNRALRIPRRAFLELIEQDSGIAYTMLSELAARVRRLERQPAPSVT